MIPRGEPAGERLTLLADPGALWMQRTLDGEDADESAEDEPHRGAEEREADDSARETHFCSYTRNAQSRFSSVFLPAESGRLQPVCRTAECY